MGQLYGGFIVAIPTLIGGVGGGVSSRGPSLFFPDSLNRGVRSKERQLHASVLLGQKFRKIER